MSTKRRRLSSTSGSIKENSRGLRTQPCGAPVLRMIREEVLLPILTDCGLWVRKSRLQSQREEPSPRPWSLEMSFVGIMVLKAELQSINRIKNKEKHSTGTGPSALQVCTDHAACLN